MGFTEPGFEANVQPGSGSTSRADPIRLRPAMGLARSTKTAWVRIVEGAGIGSDSKGRAHGLHRHDHQRNPRVDSHRVHRRCFSARGSAGGADVRMGNGRLVGNNAHVNQEFRRPLILRALRCGILGPAVQLAKWAKPHPARRGWPRYAPTFGASRHRPVPSVRLLPTGVLLWISRMRFAGAPVSRSAANWFGSIARRARCQRSFAAPTCPTETEQSVPSVRRPGMEET